MFEETLAAADDAARPARRAAVRQRADWLDAAADALDAASDELVPVAMEETNLTEGRLTGELTRTTFQARLFAKRLRSGEFDRDRHDLADPDWSMGPRPDLRRTHIAIGPVAVFAASNFPFAFSVAGGDTVSALAAGCPVVVKAHPGHPGLSRATADIVNTALRRAGAPDGVFGMVEGFDAGADLVRDRRIKAVGFTGSVRGGRALFDLAVGRADPIPFYGELGSTNPVVVTPAGWDQRGAEIAEGFAGSMLLGSGQFCTKPGVVLVPDAAAFVDAVPLKQVGPMLTTGIESAYTEAVAQLATRPGITVAAGSVEAEPLVPVLLRTDGAIALADPDILLTECFGPAALVCEYKSTDEVEQLIGVLGGTLTATVQASGQQDDSARTIVDLLMEKTGRVVWNQWPTGVSVTDAQQHGGPWPATTTPLTTSVGTEAIWRFLRPVTLQNLP